MQKWKMLFSLYTVLFAVIVYTVYIALRAHTYKEKLNANVKHKKKELL